MKRTFTVVCSKYHRRKWHHIVTKVYDKPFFFRGWLVSKIVDWIFVDMSKQNIFLNISIVLLQKWSGLYVMTLIRQHVIHNNPAWHAVKNIPVVLCKHILRVLLTLIKPRQFVFWLFFYGVSYILLSVKSLDHSKCLLSAHASVRSSFIPLKEQQPQLTLHRCCLTALRFSQSEFHMIVNLHDTFILNSFLNAFDLNKTIRLAKPRWKAHCRKR